MSYLTMAKGKRVYSFVKTDKSELVRSSNPAGSHTSAQLSQCKVSVIARLSGKVRRTGRKWGVRCSWFEELNTDSGENGNRNRLIPYTQKGPY